MGQQSRRDKPALRAAKDPFRFQRANIVAKQKRVDQLAEAFHMANADLQKHKAILAAKEKALAPTAPAAVGVDPASLLVDASLLSPPVADAE